MPAAITAPATGSRRAMEITKFLTEENPLRLPRNSSTILDIAAFQDYL